LTRFVSWLSLGVAAAVLVVASVSFSLAAIAALAFAISIGTLLVSVGIAYADRTDGRSIYAAVLIGVISAWTIVASLVFSQPTVRHLALGASLAITGLAVAGLTAHEVTVERAARLAKDGAERDSRLAAAACTQRRTAAAEVRWGASCRGRMHRSRRRR
jgi:hypothetical protein